MGGWVDVGGGVGGEGVGVRTLPAPLSRVPSGLRTT